ncbi:MAG TPA: D-alanyl-D-alanine carboxypeptidase family protein [Limnochordia bacterium]|nr:D-alanyl-D-alanine carboxypeptidase family protein [Limnochordia bacterium]
MKLPSRRALSALMGLLAAVWIAASGHTGEAERLSVMVPVTADPHIGYMPGYETGPQISAQAAIVFDNTTGTVLYAKNAQTARPMASTTKIMTALLAMERGKLDDVVRVSPYAASTRGSSAHLYAGQEIKLIDLLHGLLLRSGNDAAVAIGEHLAGTEDNFVKLMNQRAAELGIVHTRFQNPHGLDKGGHFSTAYDLALMARVALLYPTFAQIVGTKSYAAPSGTVWHNTNRLLWSFDGAEGVKTGTTSLAGNCLVAAASRDGMQLITVVLGSANRWADSRALLEYGFGQYHLVRLAEKGSVLAVLPVAGADEQVVAVAEQPLSVVVGNKDVGKLRTRLELDPIAAPLHRLQTIGRYDVYIGDQLVAQVPLVAAADVPKSAWWRRLWRALTGQRAPSGPPGAEPAPGGSPGEAPSPAPGDSPEQTPGREIVPQAPRPLPAPALGPPI